MTRLTRGLIVAGVHCAIVLILAGKYYWDREHLPRAWVKAAPYDPDMPLRGRYVNLQLVVDGPATDKTYTGAKLSVREGRLIATPDPRANTALWHRDDIWVIAPSVQYFIPEHIPDPSRRLPGEELWVEVSVPRSGPPRPIRLGVKKFGTLAPLEIR